VKEKDKYVYC